jgi:Ca2+-binding RTX toxin-like protein
VRAAKGLAAVAMALGIWSPATGAAPPDKERDEPPPRCAGLKANVVGTEKRDVLRLGAKEHRRHKRLVVASLGGSDRIIGTGRRDIICTASGPDRVLAGGGSDRVFSGHGDDRVAGGRGKDLLRLGRGRDRAAGGGGADVVNASWEADIVSAGAGADLVLAGGAKDVVSGGSGPDRLLAQIGDDRLSGGSGADVLSGQIGSDRLRGGRGADRLTADRGRDRLRGGAGGDALDAGPGPDALSGGAGADSILAREGGDDVNGGPGGDRILGGAGGDVIDGDAGNDLLYGQLVDDTVRGGEGDDVISGGQGVDDIHGGGGNDLLRGDANVDYQTGDAGDDTVSYATATPPGPTGSVDGAQVNLRNERALEDPPQPLVHDDDPRELVREIENVIGSDFGDELTGKGGGIARGLGGSELCSGFASAACDAQGPGPARVTLDSSGPDPGLLLRGAAGGASESFTLSVGDGYYAVATSLPVTAGPGCSSVSPLEVRCGFPAAPIGYATLYGGGGDDTLRLGPGFPDPGVVVLDGGAGSDAIAGAAGAEILIGGPSGRDHLAAGPGDDAIFSGPGGDVLQGGVGSDQLVTSAPCDGQDFSGGPGAGDIAGFGQTQDRGITAHLSGPAYVPGDPSCNPTIVRGDNEVLEGTQYADELHGDRRDNPLILGNEGDDVLYGAGGRDVLRGEFGSDSYFGGGGRDLLSAHDGARDAILSCGPGGNRVVRDRLDPPARGCKKAKAKRKPKGKR